MQLTEARNIIEKTLNDECAAFDFEDITVSSEITYQNELGEPCECDDKNMCFMSGDLFVRHAQLSDNELLGFSMVLECKGRDMIKDADINREIESFKDELAHFRGELSKSQCIPEFISALAAMAEEQSCELEKQLNEQVAKIDK
ncbi:MAG: hypothetical protein IJW03_00210, partial [Clostridia bacterium]|nr:hypothetical protein [Clostridia bacterium]